ncbi:MAG: hypothetical protein U1G08_21430 [Verrucomicrobiota bacterium]
MNPKGPLRSRVILAASLLLASGCTTGLGPRAIQSERPDYNQQIVRSSDEQMLLNVVRLRYNDSPLFLELGSVVTSYGYDAGVSAGGQINTPNTSGQATLGTAFSYSEHPTITYSPLTGDQFADRMLSPIPLDSLMLFTQSGWSSERLLLVAVQRINDLFNAPTAAGPVPERKPSFEEFLETADRIQKLSSLGLLGLNWERKGHETNAPGRDPHFWIHMPPGTNSPQAQDVAAVRKALQLEPGRDDFSLNAFPFKRRPDEVGIRCRSLMSILYFLSTAVEVPAPHLAEGLVTITRDEQGHSFDWKQLSGRVLTIHSQPERPVHAAIAVKHRGWWFYIADNDPNSKVTFTLLNTLFELQATTGSGKSPVLTLPVGG